MRWLLLLPLAGCDLTSDPVEPGSEPTDVRGTGSVSETPDETTPDETTLETTPAEGDAALVQGLIDGSMAPDDVFPTVAWSGGFPVEDAGGLWFVHWYDGGDWAVAGDFNEWSPEPMQAGPGFWYLFVDGLDPDDLAGAGYKFVNDGADWVADPWARSYSYDDNGELSYVAPPDDTWHLERWPGLEGQGLVPRDVRVYVPPGDGPFDVLYAHDGQNLFDPAGIWGGWRLQEALGRTGDMLVVGIDNTADRMTEYTHVDDYVLEAEWIAEGDEYAALVHDDLRPHIESTYATSGHDGLMGSSLGGLISLHIAWAYPGDYDYVASLSGTLGWGRFSYSNETMQERWLASPPPDITVYADSGGSPGPDGVCVDVDGDGFTEDDPDGADNYCETREFVDALAANGFVWDDTLFHWHELDAPHNEAAWADRVDLPLQLFLESK